MRGLGLGLLALLTYALASQPAAAVLPPPSLAYPPNGDFESGKDGWHARGDAVIAGGRAAIGVCNVQRGEEIGAITTDGPLFSLFPLKLAYDYRVVGIESSPTGYLEVRGLTPTGAFVIERFNPLHVVWDCSQRAGHHTTDLPIGLTGRPFNLEFRVVSVTGGLFFFHVELDNITLLANPV